MQGDIEIVQTLEYVAPQARGNGLGLVHADDLRAFKGEPPGHDKPDVAAAQNDALFHGHHAHEIGVVLGRSGGENARRAGAVYGHLLCGALPAAG